MWVKVVAKKKQTKCSLECDSCEMKFTVSYTGRGTVECCPFCGEPVTVTQDELPLLNDFEQLDDYEDDLGYDDEDYEDDDV